MSAKNRPVGFWVIVVFFVIATVLILIGQTVAIFNYDLTVQLGLQESPDEVGQYGVQVNRAFGVGDTIVYIPLMIASLLGLWLKKRWSLITTAAVASISVYWSVTCTVMFVFLKSTANYKYQPGLEIWIYLAAFCIFGVWGLWYVLCRGECLLE